MKSTEKALSRNYNA